MWLRSGEEVVKCWRAADYLCVGPEQACEAPWWGCLKIKALKTKGTLLRMKMMAAVQDSVWVKIKKFKSFHTATQPVTQQHDLF